MNLGSVSNQRRKESGAKKRSRHLLMRDTLFIYDVVEELNQPWPASPQTGENQVY